MMDELWTPKEFYDSQEFPGSLSKGTEVVDDLQILVQYSLIREGQILGKIIGDRQTSNDLDALSKQPGPYLELISESPYDKDRTRLISSEKVFFQKRTTRYSFDDPENQMSYVVSELTFHDITFTETFPKKERGERTLSFVLTGPKLLGLLSMNIDSNPYGEIFHKVTNSKIDLGEEISYDVHIIPWFVRDQSSENYELITKLYILQLKTEKTREELSDKKFIEDGKELVDDILLLFSFNSRNWTTWFRYELGTDDRVVKHIRKSRECSQKESGWEDSLVDPPKSREFLKTGLSNLRQLTSDGLDLRLPITFFLTGLESKYREEQYLSFIMSLEKLKDIFSIRESFDKNLSETDFNSLRDSLKELIKEKIGSKTLRGKIYPKLRELNRPSFDSVLDEILEKFDVEWKDLYPNNHKRTIIQTRDDLLHSSKTIDFKFLSKESYRLRSIIERILLRMLGWKDISNSPKNYIKEWLTED